MTRFVPVSHARQAGWLWRRFDSFAFVQDHPLVPIVLGEHEQLATTLPIVGGWTEGALQPMALTRLGPRTALVAPNGVWRGVHVPALLQVYPFCARDTGRSGRPELLVDASSPLVQPRPDAATGPEWEPFFEAEGQLAPALAEVLAFLHARAPSARRSQAAMAALDAVGGLTAAPPIPGLSLPDEVLWPDAASLAGLGRTEIAHLHRAGALALAQAMLVARHHLPFLVQAEARLSQPPAGAHPRTPSADDDALAGFLDAVAQARQRDTSGPPDPGGGDDGSR